MSYEDLKRLQRLVNTAVSAWDTMVKDDACKPEYKGMDAVFGGEFGVVVLKRDDGWRLNPEWWNAGFISQ